MPDTSYLEPALFPVLSGVCGVFLFVCFSFTFDCESHPIFFSTSSFLLNLVTADFCVVSKELPKTLQYTVL